MRPTSVIFRLGLVLTLAGCSSMHIAEPQAPGAGEFLAHYRQLVMAAPEEQRRAFENAQGAYDKVPDDTNRLRLALTLILPRAPWRNDAQLLQLLSELGSNSPEQRDLALLMEMMVDEQTRLLREELRKAELLQQRFEAFRDDRKRIEALQQKMEALREECKRANILQQKLDSLRAIDRERRRQLPNRSAP